MLKGPNRGHRLSPRGLEEILRGARERAGLPHATCHELRHTCLTRLREVGMALEAVQAQGGHCSIESTRSYLHLANDWLANEYRKASEAIDAQVWPTPRRAHRDRRRDSTFERSAVGADRDSGAIVGGDADRVSGPDEPDVAAC